MGLPALMVQIGKNEILYDDATRLRDAALAEGIDVTFETASDGFHILPVFVSAGLLEAAQAINSLNTFIKTHSSAAQKCRCARIRSHVFSSGDVTEGTCPAIGRRHHRTTCFNHQQQEELRQ
jgi:hypothetical protein